MSEPGLGALLVKELKHRDVIRAKTRAQSWHLRNYDLLVFPDSQVVGLIAASRIALDVLACPVFGRHKITERQLDRLAEKDRCSWEAISMLKRSRLPGPIWQVRVISCGAQIRQCSIFRETT